MTQTEYAASAPTTDQLTDDEIRGLVERCPESQRWAFEGWLRGERLLDGDLIEEPS